METSIGYANTIIPKALYPVNRASGIKWLEIGKKIRDRWGQFGTPKWQIADLNLTARTLYATISQVYSQSEYFESEYLIHLCRLCCNHHCCSAGVAQ
jgi:hypothetical protein